MLFLQKLQWSKYMYVVVVRYIVDLIDYFLKPKDFNFKDCMHLKIP